MTRTADPFRRLYDANHARVHRLLTRIVGPQQAEDLTQIVFTKAAAALPTFRGDADASTWLHRIAANVAADWLRSPSAQVAKKTIELPDPTGEPDTTGWDLPDPASLEQELIRKDMRECIRGVIAELPASLRSVLVLGELGGMTDDEVAHALGIRRGAAKVRLHRARQHLKKALEARCEFYRDADNELACEPKATACERQPCAQPRPAGPAAKAM